MSSEIKNPSAKCIKQRIKRHGADIVLSRGRPKLSVSQKKHHRCEYLRQKKLQKITDGTYKPRGRPKKE
jgi:predicted subunit of tRNA(5-methylaminomethyl-2-thiouridylate) methyltransferase